MYLSCIRYNKSVTSKAYLDYRSFQTSTVILFNNSKKFTKFSLTYNRNNINRYADGSIMSNNNNNNALLHDSHSPNTNSSHLLPTNRMK